jgi:putative DNA primase/helicase
VSKTSYSTNGESSIPGRGAAPTSPWAKKFVGPDAPKTTMDAVAEHAMSGMPIVACAEYVDGDARIRRPAVPGKDQSTSDLATLQEWFGEGDYLPGLDWQKKGWLPLDIPAECGEVPEELRDTLTIRTPSSGWIVIFDAGANVEFETLVYDAARRIEVPETHIILPHDPAAGWSFENTRKPAWVPDCVRRALGMRRPQTKKPAAKSHIIIQRASETKPEPIDWLWKGWLARGMFHILGGHGGSGKSTLAGATMASVITTGGRWPDGTQCSQPGDVVIWSSEDHWANTLVPRFLAAGGDDTRFFNSGEVGGSDGKARLFDPSRDLELLSDLFEQLPNPVLFILDPVILISQRKAGDTAMIRGDMAPLVHLLQKHQVAGIGITHFSKGTAETPLAERFTGSHAWAAQARLCHATVFNEATGRRRLIRQAKGNICKPGGGFDYEIEENTLDEALGKDIETSCVVWGEYADGPAQQLYDEIAGTSSGRPSRRAVNKQSLAEDFILQQIPNPGDVILSAELEERATKGEGIKPDTLKNARGTLRNRKLIASSKNSQGLWVVTRLRPVTVGDFQEAA